MVNLFGIWIGPLSNNSFHFRGSNRNPNRTGDTPMNHCPETLSIMEDLPSKLGSLRGGVMQVNIPFGWWQLKHFLMFTPKIGEEDSSCWRAYFFPDGLVQPPTSHTWSFRSLGYIQTTIFVDSAGMFGPQKSSKVKPFPEVLSWLLQSVPLRMSNLRAPSRRRKMVDLSLVIPIYNFF